MKIITNAREDGYAALEEDHLEIFFGESGENGWYRHFAVSAGGGRFSEFAELSDWEAVTTVADDRWSAEIRIPLSLLPLGLQYEIVDGFTAIGQVRYSLPLSFWRKLVYFVALFVCPALFGAEAAFFAEPISDLLGPAVSIVVYLLVMNRVLKKRLLTRRTEP